MVRDFFCVLFALLVLIWMLLPVSAVMESGEIQVYPMRGDKYVSGGTVTLYHVGKPVPGGFQLTGSLSHNVVSDQDVFSEKFLRWILRRLPEKGLEAEVEEKEGAVFEDLEEGLYVIVQKEPAPGHTAFRSFIVSLPMGEQWKITANPKVIANSQAPETGDEFSVIFGFAGMILSAMGIAWMTKYKGKIY